MQIKQLDVVEQHGILLFRTGDKGKDSNVYVFRLREFENSTISRSAEIPNDREDEQECEDNGDEDDVDDDADESEENDCDNFTRATTKFKPLIRRTRVRVRPLAVRGRAHIKERRLARTRGCHLYTVTMPGGSHLRMVCTEEKEKKNFKFSKVLKLSSGKLDSFVLLYTFIYIYIFFFRLISIYNFNRT